MGVTSAATPIAPFLQAPESLRRTGYWSLVCCRNRLAS